MRWLREIIPSNFVFTFLRYKRVLKKECSVVGKPLCYHASDPGSIPRGGHTNRSPYLLALQGQLSLSILPRSVNEYRMSTNSGSSTMRVAPIDHHWWYDRQLRTSDPGSVDRTHVNSVDRTSVQVCIISLKKESWGTCVVNRWL